MKRKFICILLATTFILAACTNGDATPAPQAQPGSAPQTQASGTDRVDIIIGTAGTAGTYYIVAVAMAQVINQHSDFLNIIAQPTRGSIENINLVNAGDIQMGMSNADGVYWATTGTGMYTDLGEQNLSAVMTLYMSAGQMSAMANSGIATYADLAGRRVNLGPPGTTIVEMSMAILRAYGIDPEADIDPFFLSFDEGMTMLTDGDIDASFLVGGIPVPAVVNAATMNDIVLVNASDAALDSIVANHPYFTRYTIPAGTYQGVDFDVNTLKIMTYIFASSDLADDVVYEFVRLALEHRDEYLDAHVVIAEISPETAVSQISRIHPGAERYFRSIGVMP